MTSRGIFPRARSVLCAAALIAAPVFAQEALAPVAAASATPPEPQPAPDPAAALPVPAVPAAGGCSDRAPGSSGPRGSGAAGGRGQLRDHLAGREERRHPGALGLAPRLCPRPRRAPRRRRGAAGPRAQGRAGHREPLLHRRRPGAREHRRPRRRRGGGGGAALQAGRGVRARLPRRTPALPARSSPRTRRRSPRPRAVRFRGGGGHRAIRASPAPCSRTPLGVYSPGASSAGWPSWRCSCAARAALRARRAPSVPGGRGAGRRGCSRPCCCSCRSCCRWARCPCSSPRSGLRPLSSTRSWCLALVARSPGCWRPLPPRPSAGSPHTAAPPWTCGWSSTAKAPAPRSARLQRQTRRAGRCRGLLRARPQGQARRRPRRRGEAVPARLEAQDDAPSAQAALRNNLGNVFVLQGETAKAVAQYRQAVDLNEGLAAPHFNLARALAMGGVEGLEKAQAEQARAVELDRAAVEAFTGGSLQANRKSNKFVMDVPLDDAELAPLREVEARAPRGWATRCARASRPACRPGSPPSCRSSPRRSCSGFTSAAAPAAERPVRPLRSRGLQALRSRGPSRRGALCPVRERLHPPQRRRRAGAGAEGIRHRGVPSPPPSIAPVAVLSGAGHVMMGHTVRGIAFLW